MESVTEIIGAMRQVAPPGQRDLDEATVRRLSELTQLLIAAKTEAVGEHGRFLAIRERGLCLPEAQLAARLSGATVLVTGGTGCIGSTLMAQLASRCTGRLVSVSRGLTDGWPRLPEVEYRYADVRDRDAMGKLFAEVKPDLVFHVAAQRDRAGRGRGASHCIHERARYPQCAERGSGGGRASGGLCVDRQGAAALFAGYVHRF